MLRLAPRPSATHRISTGARCRPVALCTVLLLVLAACATPPPAPPAQSLPLPPPPPPIRSSVHATWTFQRRPHECEATARAGAVSLRIVAREARPVLLTLSPLASDAPHWLRLRFAGPAGTWAIEAAAPHGHSAVASFGPGTTGLSRLLIMLSGGTLTPEQPAAGLPAIVLPPSGADGTHWFDCVQHTSG